MRKCLLKYLLFCKKKLRITCRKIYSEGWQNCLVYGDEDRIVEVMQNLIENAVMYGNGGYLGIKSEDEEVTAENKDGCFNVTVVLKKV